MLVLTVKGVSPALQTVNALYLGIGVLASFLLTWSVLTRVHCLIHCHISLAALRVNVGRLGFYSAGWCGVKRTQSVSASSTVHSSAPSAGKLTLSPSCLFGRPSLKLRRLSKLHRSTPLEDIWRIITTYLTHLYVCVTGPLGYLRITDAINLNLSTWLWWWGRGEYGGLPIHYTS